MSGPEGRPEPKVSLLYSTLSRKDWLVRYSDVGYRVFTFPNGAMEVTNFDTDEEVSCSPALRRELWMALDVFYKRTTAQRPNASRATTAPERRLESMELLSELGATPAIWLVRYPGAADYRATHYPNTAIVHLAFHKSGRSVPRGLAAQLVPEIRQQIEVATEAFMAQRRSEEGEDPVEAPAPRV